MPSINDKIVLNFRDVRRALEDLPKRVTNNVVRRAIYAGAVLVRDDARRRVPVDTGALRNAIVAQANAKKPGEVTASIGVARKQFTRGKRAGKQPRRYAHLVEFGTPKKGARPFLRPAVDTNVDAILDAVAEKMRQGVDVESAKARARG